MTLLFLSFSLLNNPVWRDGRALASGARDERRRVGEPGREQDWEPPPGGGSCLRPCQVTNVARGRGPGDAFWRQALELSPRGAPARRVGRWGRARIGRERGGGAEASLGCLRPARAQPSGCTAGFSRARRALNGSEPGGGRGAREGAQGTRGRACGAGRGGGRCVGPLGDRGADAALPTSDAKRRRSCRGAQRRWRQREYGARVFDHSADSARWWPAASEGFRGADHAASG